MDKDNSLLKRTVQEKYPPADGLKYLNADGEWIRVQINDSNRFLQPDDGWYGIDGKRYFVIVEGGGMLSGIS